ncbi:MAG: hypothetical protein KBA26_14355 [Candidatus Delongbacteria bacterium]|nr:hypothetical protein [Candidatus Delongbacteria bacterium]
MKLVIDECFWGDYRIDPEQSLQRIEMKDQAFIRFLVSRILEHSSFASSRLLGLFSSDELDEVLLAYKGESRLVKRAEMARAAIFGIAPWGVHQWPVR